MKKTTLFVVSVFAAMLVSSIAHADILTGHVSMGTWSTLASGDSQNSVYVSPMTATNHTSGQSNFLLFCGDYNTMTSAGFNNGAGQEYNAYAMGASNVFYSDIQKDRLNNLFGYAYSTAFDLDGNILNADYAQAMQLAIWSILHEETDNYDILGGSFRLVANYTSDVVDITNNLLKALLGEADWSSMGMDMFIDYDLTVYIAEGGRGVSQTLISVTGPPTREGAATPEPATMVVLGLGLAGLGLARRANRK